jgi:hypothetical protein
MPSYEYTDIATGERCELIVPIAQRDQVPGKRRIAVPPRLNTVGFAEDIHSQAYGIRQGLKDMEGRYGRARIQQDTGMSINQLARTWA